MTEVEILKQAIFQARVNTGFEYKTYNEIYDELDVKLEEHHLRDRDYYRFIFSHEFAEAFWRKAYDGLACDKHGVKFCRVFEEAKYCNDCGKELKPKKLFNKADDWEYHLQNMVALKKPLKYLERFLVDDSNPLDFSDELI